MEDETTTNTTKQNNMECSGPVISEGVKLIYSTLSSADSIEDEALLIENEVTLEESGKELVTNETAMDEAKHDSHVQEITNNKRQIEHNENIAVKISKNDIGVHVENMSQMDKADVRDSSMNNIKEQDERNFGLEELPASPEVIDIEDNSKEIKKSIDNNYLDDSLRSNESDVEMVGEGDKTIEIGDTTIEILDSTIESIGSDDEHRENVLDLSWTSNKRVLRSSLPGRKQSSSSYQLTRSRYNPKSNLKCSKCRQRLTEVRHYKIDSGMKDQSRIIKDPTVNISMDVEDTQALQYKLTDFTVYDKVTQTQGHLVPIFAESLLKTNKKIYLSGKDL